MLIILHGFERGLRSVAIVVDEVHLSRDTAVEWSANPNEDGVAVLVDLDPATLDLAQTMAAGIPIANGVAFDKPGNQ